MAVIRVLKIGLQLGGLDNAHLCELEQKGGKLNGSDCVSLPSSYAEHLNQPK